MISFGRGSKQDARDEENRVEMKIFWISLPFLAGVFLVNLRYVPGTFLFLVGGALILIGIALFFSARREIRLTKEVRAEESDLEGIVSSLEDALVAYDENFKVFFFSPAAEKLFKLQRDDIVGHKLQAQDVEKSDLQLLTQVVFPSLAPGMISRSPIGTYPQVVELSFADPALELRVVTSPINDGRGGIIGFVKIVRNRTREAFLIKSKNEFLTVASHQLRGPITNIDWALQTLLEDKTLSQGSASLVQSASTASKELLAIIEDLLNITKIEEGHFGYNFQPMNLVEFVNKVLTEALPQARRASVKLFFDKPKEQVPQTIIDPQKLSMVFNNLLDNAIRYNVLNGEVVVKIDRLPDRPFVEVTVKDSGIGIPPQQVEKIFTKFFRADNALKFQTEGSGLGLYIAKNIIQAHGGQIWTESELNRGSVFHFTLPTDPTLIPPHEVVIE